jgi:hypothetical protein
LVVKGNARVTGILSIGTGTITLDPNDNAIIIADVKIRRDHSSGDIRFLDTEGNLSNIIANTVVVGSGNSAVNIANVNGTVVFTDSDNTVIHSMDRTNVSYLGNVSYSGIVTAAYFVGDGSLLTNVNIGYANTAGIATVAQGLTGTPNITVGVVTATKYYGDGSSLTGINAGGITPTSSINTTGIITANSYYVGSTQVINSAGQWIGSGLSVHSNIDGGLPNSIYGGIPVIDGGGV